jgi:hypothetical protein
MRTPGTAGVEVPFPESDRTPDGEADRLPQDDGIRPEFREQLRDRLIAEAAARIAAKAG